MKKKIKHTDVRTDEILKNLIDDLAETGFNAKRLAIACKIYEKMVKTKNCVKFFSLAGAMIPVGMQKIVYDMIDLGFIDVLVTTGANLTHDVAETLGHPHLQGDTAVINQTDEDLYSKRLNRIYDVFLPEENYKIVEKELLHRIKDIFFDKDILIAPSELLRKLGENLKERCILSIAAKNNIPIFVPAFSDSEFALDLIVYMIKEGYCFKFDILKDILTFGNMIKNSKNCGTLIIGGGVPRNWAQQIFPLLDQIEKLNKGGYDYSVRIHTGTEYDGGLSGSTFSEAKSWGKYSLESKSVSIWCDATIALPILITGLLLLFMGHLGIEALWLDWLVLAKTIILPISFNFNVLNKSLIIWRSSGIDTPKKGFSIK